MFQASSVTAKEAVETEQLSIMGGSWVINNSIIELKKLARKNYPSQQRRESLRLIIIKKRLGDLLS